MDDNAARFILVPNRDGSRIRRSQVAYAEDIANQSESVRSDRAQGWRLMAAHLEQLARMCEADPEGYSPFNVNELSGDELAAGKFVLDQRWVAPTSI